jgi:NAD(P)-dependent dehydrogenase (short-subunit alcohol dehydrogenase family)
MSRLENKIALVTGAGSGLGRAITLEFARQGAHVFASDRNEESVIETVEEVGKEGGEATALRSDVSDKEDIANLLSTIKSASGKLHVLVNNAGITQREDFRNITDEQWQEILDVNLTAAMRLSRDALGLLRASGSGSIINISSIMSRIHIRQLSAYSTTKAALAGMSRAMAVEYSAFDVRVNYICPGYAETAMTERILRNQIVRQGLLDRTPMKRFVHPEDIAKAVRFLVSDDADWITGQILAVDGGHSWGRCL